MIYFDNSATTKPSENCILAMSNSMRDNYANASSLHIAGVKSHHEIDNTKKLIADSLNCTPAEILLAPGGTYCNNLAIVSAVLAMRRRGRKIVVSSIEHPSVEQCVTKLKDDGFEVVFCNPLTDDFENEIDENTILVSCMYVNNETGLILPVEKLKNIILKKSSPALLHIDAVQAYGKIDVNVKKLNCDFLTVSAHKINGPKGIGALYVRKGVRTFPLVYGGEQENSLIPGTYNVPAIVGFGVAVNELKLKDKTHLTNLYNYFLKKTEEFDYIKVNSFGNHAGHIINVTFDGYLGENVLHYLETFEIFVSQGSACSSHSKQKGKAILALGKDKKTADGSVRVSFGYDNTIDEIDEFFKVCSEIPQKLIKLYK